MKRILLSYAARAPLLAYRARDPVGLCHAYPDPRDREVAALLAALLAFGKVRAFLPVVERLLGLLGPRPRRWVESLEPGRARSFFGAFRLRLWKGDDILLLLGNLRALLREHAGLEAAFMRPPGPPDGGTGNGHSGPPGRAEAALLHRRRLAGLAERLASEEPARWTGREEPPPYYRHLVVDPAAGSACKRWNLFLRWVARPADGVDLGLWKDVAARDLIVPLDVHVGRISLLIGLRTRRTLDWRAAEEVTEGLRRIDPEDPLRFDLPLSHLGISAGCRGRYLPAVCGPCGIRSLCSVYARAVSPAARPRGSGPVTSGARSGARSRPARGAARGR